MAKPKSTKAEVKLRLFVVGFLKHGNATQAARDIGHKDGPGIYETGRRLLRKAEQAGLLGAAVQKLEAKGWLQVEKLEEELDALAHFDPATMYDSEGKLLAIKDMPERTRKALAGFDEDALFEMVQTGTGPRGGVIKERLQVGVTRKVKWAEKRGAIELAMKRRGLLVEKHQVEHSGSIDGRTVTAAEWEALALLRHKVRAAAPESEPA